MANTHSLSLNGTNQYCTAPSWKPTDFTLEGWIKPTAVNVRQTILTLGQSDVIFDLEDTAKIRLRVYNGASYELYDSLGTLTAGAWNRIAASYTTATKAWVLYIGTGATANASGTGTSALAWDAGTDVITLGAAAAGARPVGGLLDDWRYWSAVRSGADLAANASKELVGNETNLYDYYTFNNTLNTLVSGGHNLTGVNTPTFSTDKAFTWPIATAAKSRAYFL